MSEPVTAEELKIHARISTDAEDDYLETLIAGAREKVEHDTDRALVPKTITLRLDRFPCGRRFVELPGSPVREITSVAYLDADGDTQTFSSSNYTLLAGADPLASRLLLKEGADWPSDLADQGAPITVTYVAGYATAAEVPRMLHLATLWLATWWYEQRMQVNIGNIISELPDHLSHVVAAQRITRVHVADVAGYTSAVASTGASPGSLVNLPTITGLTGGGATKLDGLSTTTYAAGTVVILTFGDAAQWWKLRTLGVGESEDGASLVVPDDSASLVWVRIL